MENFRSHERISLEFGDGVILLLGPNGSGKTGVLDGIAYAIYPGLFSGRMASLIRRGAERMRVSLTFEAGGRTYRVVRERTRDGQASARLLVWEEGEGGSGEFRPVQFGQRDVSEEMRRILGVGPTAFVDAVYVRQGEMLGFLNETPARRKEVVSKLLGSELFSHLEGEVKGALVRYRERRARASARAERASELRERLDRLRREIVEGESRSEELRGEISKLRGELISVRERLREVEGRRSAHEAVSTSLDRLRRDRSSREERLREIRRRMRELSGHLEERDELRKMAEAAEPIRRLREIRIREEALDGRLRELDRWEDRLREYRGRLMEEASLREAISALREEKGRLESEVGSLRAELSGEPEVRSRLRELEGRAERLRAAWVEISEAAAGGGITLRSPDGALSKVNEALEIADREIAVLEGERSDLERRIGEARAEIGRIDGWISSLEGAEGKCPLCGSKLEDEKRRMLISKYEDRRRELSEEAASLEERLSLTVARMGELRARRETLLRVVRACAESGIADVTSVESEVEELRERLSRLGSKRERLSGMEARISEIEEELKRLREREVELNYLRRRVEEMEEEGESRRMERERLEREREKLERERDVVVGLIMGAVGAVPEDLEAAYREAQEARERLDKISEILEEYRSLQREAEIIGEDIERMREREVELEGEMRSIGYDESEESYLRSREEDLERRLEGAERELARLEGELGRMRREEGEILRELEGAEKAREESERLERFISILERVKQAFGKEGIQRVMRERVRPIVEAHAWEYLSKFGIECDGLTLSDDWEIRLIRRGESYDLAELSGGEAVAVALSLRMGLARALSGGRIEMLMLDEPTIHLDEDRRAELVGLLGEVDLPQVIVVSHTGEFEQSADEVISLPPARRRVRAQRVY